MQTQRAGLVEPMPQQPKTRPRRPPTRARQGLGEFSRAQVHELLDVDQGDDDPMVAAAQPAGESSSATATLEALSSAPTLALTVSSCARRAGTTARPRSRRRSAWRTPPRPQSRCPSRHRRLASGAGEQALARSRPRPPATTAHEPATVHTAIVGLGFGQDSHAPGASSFVNPDSLAESSSARRMTWFTAPLVTPSRRAIVNSCSLRCVCR